MNTDITYWNYGLLFATICVIIGSVGTVSAQRSEDRGMALGMLLQGVALAFVAGGIYFHGAVDLRLSGLTVIGLLLAQSFLGLNSDTDDKRLDENTPL